MKGEVQREERKEAKMLINKSIEGIGKLIAENQRQWGGELVKKMQEWDNKFSYIFSLGNKCLVS